MVDALINSMIAGIVGTVAFIVVRQVINSQDTTSWSALENAIMPLVPSAIAILLLVGIFLGLTRFRTGE
ncbi:hypothetical protein LCGC14_0799060 [marine sediment metagenome]|uniref:Uncharacterized protein n=1 Tax=marine sediment metagenome TaxID=412755 RepID=A0A0F9SXD0_9ZZZZ